MELDSVGIKQTTGLDSYSGGNPQGGTSNASGSESRTSDGARPAPDPARCAAAGDTDAATRPGGAHDACRQPGRRRRPQQGAWAAWRTGLDTCAARRAGLVAEQGSAFGRGRWSASGHVANAEGCRRRGGRARATWRGRISWCSGGASSPSSRGDKPTAPTRTYSSIWPGTGRTRARLCEELEPQRPPRAAATPSRRPIRAWTAASPVTPAPGRGALRSTCYASGSTCPPPRPAPVAASSC